MGEGYAPVLPLISSPNASTTSCAVVLWSKVALVAIVVEVW